MTGGAAIETVEDAAPFFRQNGYPLIAHANRRSSIFERRQRGNRCPRRLVAKSVIQQLHDRQAQQVGVRHDLHGSVSEFQN